MTAGTVHFALTTFEYGVGTLPGVDPVLGSTSLRELASRFETRHGWEPVDSYAPLLLGADDAEAHFLGRSATGDGRTELLGCTCGFSSCWPLLGTVEVDEDRVTWSGFRQPFREERDYDGFGPFVFPRADYDRAVQDLVVRLRSSRT